MAFKLFEHGTTDRGECNRMPVHLNELSRSVKIVLVRASQQSEQFHARTASEKGRSKLAARRASQVSRALAGGCLPLARHVRAELDSLGWPSASLCEGIIA